MAKVCKRAIVHGLVQGVGFRYYVMRVASRFLVNGYVRNEYDGTVEVHVEGEPVEVNAFLQAVEKGPVGSQVDSITIVDEELGDGFAGFTVRY